MKKILLLNPPGDKIYIRDYYCSKVSKTFYTYHPTDLLVLSGILSKGNQLKVIDAIAEKLSYAQTTKRVMNFNPDVIIFISGSVSYSSDFNYLKRINDLLKNRNKKKTTFIGSGDLFMEGDKSFFKHDFLDAILLDFTTKDIVDYLNGKSPKENMIYRKNKRIYSKPSPRPVKRNIKIPIPRYDLFPNRKYKYPFIRKYPFATVLTDYGCPFRCSFCIMSEIGFKLRSVDNVMGELRYLKKHGFKEIYFNDQTFGANKKRTKELLTRMIEEKFNFGWVCFSRVDVTDDKLLALMKKAGCHTVMYGVESGSQRILDKYQKGINKNIIRKTFAMTKKLGIRTFATFIMGLPDETEEDIRKTIAFAKEINPHFTAFNTAVPRVGTDMRSDSIKDGLIEKDFIEMDQSGKADYEKVMDTGQLSHDEVMRLQKKATFSFYVRPAYFTQIIRSIKSPSDFMTYAEHALSLLKNMVK